MANQTRENSIRKRKIRSRRRRIAFFRLLFLLVVFGAIVSAVVFVGYAIINWGSHIYHEYQAMYQEYTQRQEAKRGAMDPKFDGYTNVLVLGLDDGVREDGTEAPNADTIMLMSMVNESGRVRVITIPPDTWITFPGYEGEGRISTLYPRGGEPIMVRAVSNLLGISIHQYIAVDMKTFAELIDILGGIDAYVEEDMNYDDPESGLSIHLQKGYQHMDGDMAQKYLRYRGTGLGDVGRVQRQQRFIKALYQKALQLDTIPKLPAIADIFQHRMTTSAEIFDSAHLANVLRHMNSDVPVTLMLPGESAEDDERIWIPHQNEIDLRIRELFPVYEINQGSEE